MKKLIKKKVTIKLLLEILEEHMLWLMTIKKLPNSIKIISKNLTDLT